MATLSDRQMWASQGASEAAFARGQDATEPISILSMARVAYDTKRNRAPWGWKVGAYLWTKSIAAGALGLAALHLLRNGYDRILNVNASAVALLFTALTAVLLVLDLKKPERFLYILTRPNTRSWLVWGTWILMAFSLVGTVWLLMSLRTEEYNPWSGIFRILAPLAILFGAGAACYSAFLFGQAEGRDFWQSPLLFFQLLFAAIAAGAAILIILPFPSGRVIGGFLEASFLIGLAGHGLVLFLEVFGRHPGDDAARAASYLTRGEGRVPFWVGVVSVGTLLPLVFSILTGGDNLLALRIAAVLALAGLWLWEHLWVKAGQSVPLS